jgi:hypothetical protein
MWWRPQPPAGEGAVGGRGDAPTDGQRAADGAALGWGRDTGVGGRWHLGTIADRRPLSVTRGPVVLTGRLVRPRLTL